MPELEFRFDESIEQQDRIEQILRDLHQEEAQRAHLRQGSGGQADTTADSSTAKATVDRPDDSDDK